METLISVQDVYKSFGKREVLKGISFKIEQGDKLAIVGANGSGKSTLINIIVGLIKYNSGSVYFPVYKNNQKDFLQELGIQFQEGNFPKNFKVIEIIKISIEQKSRFSYKNYRSWKKESYRKIDEFLEVFQLAKLRNSKIDSLSGGEKQRLNILLAIISNPKVLILDEISTGLDIPSQKKLIKFIEAFVQSNQITLIIISHIIYEIDELTDYILMLSNGKITAKEYNNNLKQKYGNLSRGLDYMFSLEDKI